jgi:hypothetical protein
MQVSIALLADYSNISQEGKLNVLGIFNTVIVNTLPGGVHLCHLVLRFVVSPAEKGSTRKVDFKLLDPDGKDIAGQTGELHVPADGRPGPAIIDLINVIPWLQFQRYGQHRLHILVNDDSKAEIEIAVLPPPASQAGGDL